MGVLGSPTSAWVAGEVAARVACGLPAPTMVCGSLRRGRRIVSDVDLFVVTDHLLPQVWPLSLPGFRVTEKRAVCQVDGVRVEVSSCPSTSIGPMALAMTGSSRFNIACRGRAKRLGVRLNQYGLWHGEERLDYSNPIEVSEAEEAEAALLAILGIEWVPPEGRNVREFVRFPG